jgi:hypothetical protein
MAERTLGVRGPDGDNQVWITYEVGSRSGLVRLGSPHESGPTRALAMRDDPEALEREFGHLVTRH